MNLFDKLSRSKIEFKRNFNTSHLSTIRAGGIAYAAIYPKSISELLETIRLLHTEKIRYKLIGGCSNTFFRDSGYDGIVIITSLIKSIILDGDTVYASLGARLSYLSHFAAGKNVELYSNLCGIPATVGGAVRNNAGAFGESVSDTILDAEVYDPSADRSYVLSADELDLSYRSSVFAYSDLVFLSGRFKGKTKEKDKILKNISKVKDLRRKSQPSEPSLGSFFKRSSGAIPSYLIDMAGLKGISVGGASVSSKHAGFIINKNSATASDIDRLASFIETEIRSRYGVALLRECELV